MCQPFLLPYIFSHMSNREFQSGVVCLALPTAHVAIAGPALSATTIHPHAISVFASIANAKTRFRIFVYLLKKIVITHHRGA
jgi:hypothetical protein